MTNDATRLVDREEIPFFVVQYDLDWRGCDRGFMPMNDVPGNDQHSRTSRFYCGENSLDTISVPDHCLRFCNFSVDSGDTRLKSVPLCEEVDHSSKIARLHGRHGGDSAPT